MGGLYPKAATPAARGSQLFSPATDSRRLFSGIIRGGSLAQSVEQRAFNPLVQGSSP